MYLMVEYLTVNFLEYCILFKCDYNMSNLATSFAFDFFDNVQVSSVLEWILVVHSQRHGMCELWSL